MGTEKTAAEWTEIKEKIKSKWSKFGEAELESFKGNMDLITEKMQKSYGFTKDKAEQEYKDFKKTLEPTVAAAVTAVVAPAKPN